MIGVRMTKNVRYDWNKVPKCFCRTVYADGAYVHERVDLSTGEITLKRIKKQESKLKHNGADVDPFWLSHVVCEPVKVRTGTVESSKSVENPYFGMLDNFAVYEMRCEDMSSASLVVSTNKELNEDELDNAIAALVAYRPFMENYFTGISQLGNHNPLSKNVMFHLLRSLPEISSRTIYEATHYSLSYCQRLAAALRVFIKLTT